MTPEREAHAARTAELEEFFRPRKAAPSKPSWVEPARPAALDLTSESGSFITNRALSVRRCENCRRGIQYGWPRVNHTPLETSHVTYYYHPECVVTP